LQRWLLIWRLKILNLR